MQRIIGRAFVSVVVILLFVGLSFEQTTPVNICLLGNSVTLTWNPNPEADLAGYKLYQGTASGVYGTPTVLDKVTTLTVTGLAPGTYFFALKAYNTAGQESGFSNEVSTTIPVNVGPEGPPGPQGPVGPQGPPGPQGPAGTSTTEVSPRVTSLLMTEITRTTAIISWSTDVECSGLVEYGTTVSLGKSIQANNLATTDHMVQLTGLTSRVHYYIRASGSCGGKPVDSGIRTFNSK